MNKTLKKILLTVGIAAGSIALVWGILTLVRSASREAVNVYAVSDFMTTDSWGSASQSSGMVTTDQLQKIYLSSTQTVTEICVKEGQTVKKGDKLLTYDTTLSELDVQMAQIQLEREELSLKELQKELTALEQEKDTLSLLQKKLELTTALNLLQSYASDSDLPGIDPMPVIPDESKQKGTKDAPLYRLYQEDAGFIPQYTRPASGTDCYVVLYTETDDVVEAYQGVIIKPNSSIAFFYPDPLPLPSEESPLSYRLSTRLLQGRLDKLEEQLADSHTRRELLKLQQDMREELGEAEVELKLAELDLQRKRSEVEDGAVYSTLDGVVKIVRDESEAFQNSEAVVEISGGGGYYVSGVISELELGNVHIGDTVQINSWMTGTSCEGEIVSLETYPSDQSGWSGGNSNVSYYPFKAFVSEDVDLQENDYVDITYQSTGNRECWYLDNMFIRTENGKSYVYVQNESGLLEQRWITTGSSLWGSYTEIRSGLTQDDYIAFPYGKDVADGAKTQQSTPDQLYGY